MLCVDSTPEKDKLMNLEQIRESVRENMHRLAKLGNWPEWLDVEQSVLGRIPVEGSENAPGFDAGLACCLGLIPEDKQKLAAVLHAAYTPEAVEQVRSEAEAMDPDSETCWWLAACSICDEGKVDSDRFLQQIESFRSLSQNPDARVEAAKKELAKMTSTFSLDRGYPFGTIDGCMQGAYLSGHPFAVFYGEDYGIWFIGTFHDSLGLEDFEWSDEVDDQGRPNSGPVHGSQQFVKAANEEELTRALEVVKNHFGL